LHIGLILTDALLIQGPAVQTNPSRTGAFACLFERHNKKAAEDHESSMLLTAFTVICFFAIDLARYVLNYGSMVFEWQILTVRLSFCIFNGELHATQTFMLLEENVSG